MRRSWKPSEVAHTLLQTSEKRNTLHRLVHFNFCSICDRSAVSLTPSGDPQPICRRSPKPRRVGGGGRRDTCDWWWCELNRKRWRESFYQGRNTSGLKCSCTSLCIMQQPYHEAAEAETRDAYYHCCLRLTLQLYWSRKARQKHRKLKIEPIQTGNDWPGTRTTTNKWFLLLLSLKYYSVFIFWTVGGKNNIFNEYTSWFFFCCNFIQTKEQDYLRSN